MDKGAAKGRREEKIQEGGADRETGRHTQTE